MLLIENQKMHELSSFIKETMGLYFPDKKYKELIFKINDLYLDSGIKDMNRFIDTIIQRKDDQVLIENIASKLTIGETYFWRDRELFKTLEQYILPEIIERKQKNSKTIRIWSAGCSSGEEPYSIAILFDRLIPDARDWNIVINATDINIHSLKKAISGTYSEWSFRSAPSWLKEKYFTQTSPNVYELNRSIKKRVNFSYLNFFKDRYPSLTNDTSALDLILCQNVFIYFAIDDIKKISDKFYDCLTDNGMLITSASESFHYLSSRFINAHINHVSVYKRNNPVEKLSLNSNESKLEQVVDFTNHIKSERVRIKQGRIQGKVKNTASFKTPTKKDYKTALHEYDIGNYYNALQILAYLKEEKWSPEITLLMARINANQGNLLKALNLCDEVISKSKLTATAYYLKATIEIELGFFDKAYLSATKSLFLDPDFIISHFILGNLENNKENYIEANRHFRNTINLLEKMDNDEIVSETDGISAGRLKEMIKAYLVNDETVI